MCRLVGPTLLAMLLTFPIQGWAQYHTQRGAVLGGLTGAAAGAVIGDNSDKAGAGAVIGGALGLLAGGALGNTVDQEDAAYARAWQYQQHQQYQQYAQQVARTARPVSVADVITMNHQQIGDGVIISTISTQGVERPLEVPDIIQMHQQGVSEVVITAMQRAPVGGSSPVVTTRPASPVIVREYYSAPRVHYRGPASYHYHYSHGCGHRW